MNWGSEVTAVASEMTLTPCFEFGKSVMKILKCWSL
jgi:hypothetical protein